LRLALLLAAIVFLITLLVRLPARALLALLPADVTCAGPSGTVWLGSCEELRVGAMPVAGLSWALHPAAMLRLRLAADLSSQDPAAHGQAQLEFAPNGDLAISALAASVAVPGRSGLAAGIGTASLQLSIDSARIQAGHLVALVGTIDLLQLHLGNPPAELGDFELKFAPSKSATMAGQLRDLNGPLSVSGILQLSPAGAYQLEGSVAPKPGASEDVTRTLQILGPADAEGRRTISLAGSL
jgi:general secretion pathway protein N